MRSKVQSVVRLVLGVIVALLGGLAIVAGGYDDSPGLQGLGVLAIISTAVLLRLTRSEKSLEVLGALQSIGTVRSSRSEPIDDDWDSETSHIDLLPPYTERAIQGLGEFSHCIVVYLFDKAVWDERNMSRHPRGNMAWPEVGIFAQRAKDRPNRIGVTVCRVIKVENSRIYLAGLDAIEGSPVVDIKPYFVELGPRGEVWQPQWSNELMKGYW